MSWLTSPEEAAKHPRRTLAVMLPSGLVIGGVIGYFRFDRSPTWAVILGATFGAIFAYMGWKIVRDPALSQRRKSRPEARQALLRLAMPFVALAVAFVVGIAAQSVHVFIILSALGLVLAIALRLTVWR